MATDSVKPAYAGQAANVPGANVFDFAFSNPFQNESEYVPRARRVPKIQDDQPIFVDHASGKLHPLTLLTFSLTHSLNQSSHMRSHHSVVHLTDLLLRPPSHILPRKT